MANKDHYSFLILIMLMTCLCRGPAAKLPREHKRTENIKYYKPD